MPRTKWQDLDAYLIAKPAGVIAEAFGRIADPTIDKIFVNVQTAKTITLLRDTLLPRLMSGKLRIPEAEKLVGAVL